MKSCLVIGSTVCDVIINLPSIPQSTQDTNIYGQTLQLGGCAYNVVSILHQVGISYTFLSPVGTGVYGEYVAKELEKVGIVTNIHSPQENGCCYCLVEDSGERTFLSHHGAEYTFKKEWIQSLDLNVYDYIYACGIEIEDQDGENIVACLSQCKGQIIFAPGPRHMHIPLSLLEKIYALHPILHVNETEAHALSNETDIKHALTTLYQKTNNMIVVTLGEKGSMIFDGKQYRQAASKKVTVVDTIGAGDSHAGAIMAGLCVSEDLQTILEFANDIATTVVTKKGAGIPTPEALNIYHEYFG